MQCQDEAAGIAMKYHTLCEWMAKECEAVVMVRDDDVIVLL